MAGEAIMAGVGIWFALLFVILILALFGLCIFAFVFWILMLVDVAKRKFPGENDQIVWILVVVFAGIIGALVYYFVIKKKDKK